jgi:hypothetical protein
MTIQAGVPDELWEWLMGQGWRELRYAPTGVITSWFQPVT